MGTIEFPRAREGCVNPRWRSFRANWIGNNLKSPAGGGINTILLNTTQNLHICVTWLQIKSISFYQEPTLLWNELTKCSLYICWLWFCFCAFHTFGSVFQADWRERVQWELTSITGGHSLWPWERLSHTVAPKSISSSNNMNLNAFDTKMSNQVTIVEKKDTHNVV